MSEEIEENLSFAARERLIRISIKTNSPVLDFSDLYCTYRRFGRPAAYGRRRLGMAALVWEHEPSGTRSMFFQKRASHRRRYTRYMSPFWPLRRYASFQATLAVFPIRLRAWDSKIFGVNLLIILATRKCGVPTVCGNVLFRRRRLSSGG